MPEDFDHSHPLMLHVVRSDTEVGILLTEGGRQAVIAFRPATAGALARNVLDRLGEIRGCRFMVQPDKRLATFPDEPTPRLWLSSRPGDHIELSLGGPDDDDPLLIALPDDTAQEFAEKLLGAVGSVLGVEFMLFTLRPGRAF